MSDCEVILFIDLLQRGSPLFGDHHMHIYGDRESPVNSIYKLGSCNMQSQSNLMKSAVWIETFWYYRNSLSKRPGAY